jgi:hypothetical protein
MVEEVLARCSGDVIRHGTVTARSILTRSSITVESFGTKGFFGPEVKEAEIIPLSDIIEITATSMWANSFHPALRIQLRSGSPLAKKRRAGIRRFTLPLFGLKDALVLPVLNKTEQKEFLDAWKKLR